MFPNSLLNPFTQRYIIDFDIFLNLLKTMWGCRSSLKTSEYCYRYRSVWGIRDPPYCFIWPPEFLHILLKEFLLFWPFTIFALVTFRFFANYTFRIFEFLTFRIFANMPYIKFCRIVYFSPRSYIFCKNTGFWIIIAAI